jgi:cyclopropane-fatty-acyl-phospholipid synthase
MSLALYLMERGLLPDCVIRHGIRRLLKQRLRAESRGDTEGLRQEQRELIRLLLNSPLAVETRAANDQYYELPLTGEWRIVLG